MFTTFALAAALATQNGPSMGTPGVLGGPFPIPPGASAAERERIESMNRSLNKPYPGTATRSDGRAGIGPRPVQYDTGPKFFYQPGGGLFVTPNPNAPYIQRYGERRLPAFAGPHDPALWRVKPQAASFTGPPEIVRTNPMGMFGQPED